MESFLEELEDIQREIKEKLFFEKTIPPQARPDDAPDAEIHRILSRISGKWQLNRKSPPVIHDREEETLTQTVMISRNTDPSPVKQPKPAFEEEIQETVILKQNATVPRHPSAGLPQSFRNTADMDKDEDDLAKTLIIKPSGKKDLK